ncbi:MAG: hypothetical protein L0Z55_07570, partial [Planctomycetes bacterium]|nr:hypothetical protein [Planctomycetota bacterium]
MARSALASLRFFHRSGAALSALLYIVCFGVPLGAQTGIEIAGSECSGAGAPYSCVAYSQKSGTEAGKIERNWGLIELPEGEYAIGVVYRYGEMESRFPGIRVGAGKVSRLVLDTGIDFAGRAEEEGPPYRWFAYSAGSEQAVAQVPTRWGYTPLAPGDYEIGVVYRYGETELHLPA